MKALLLTAVLVPLLAAAEAGDPIVHAPAEPSEQAGPSPSPAPTPEADSVQSKAHTPLLRDRVAQLMLVALQGLYGPNNEDRVLLTQYTPGGVIIPMAVKPRAAAEYVRAIRTLGVEKEKGVPLFIGADVYRLTQHDESLLSTFVQLPSLLAVGAAAHRPATEGVAKLSAEHLNVMGFNLSFGPSLELAPTLAGALGSIHTLGSDAKLAAEAGRVMVETLLAENLLPMPTGFPGGGANRQPRTAATLLTPGPLLAQRDLLPFKEAVAAGAPLIHVANTLVPTLDDESRPASLSAAVMGDLLRGELGFDGIIVAGPLDSPHIQRLYPAAQAAVLALAAGADMLYWERAGPHPMKAVEAVAYAVEHGNFDEGVINAALVRILGLKRDRGLFKRPLPDSKKATVLESKRTYPREAYAVERRAVTVVLNRHNTLPLTNSIASVPLGVTGVIGVSELKDALRKHLKPVVEQPIATARRLGRIEDFEIQRLTSQVQGMRTAVCVLNHMRDYRGQAALIRGLREKGVQVVVVLVGYPANLPHLVEADAIVLAYSQGIHCAQTMKAVADALVGRAPLRILPTAEDLNVAAGEAQTFDVRKVVRTPAGRLPVTIAEPFVAGHAVSYDPACAIKAAQWDFGDGRRAKGLRVEHVYESPGRYTLTLTATDYSGEATSGAFPITAE